MTDQPGTPHQIVLRDDARGRWLGFRGPVRVVEARRLPEVLPALRRIEAAVESEKLYAAGFVSYEAAPAFDAALKTRPPGDLPLLWFGLYPDLEEFALPPAPTAPQYALGPWTPSVRREEYDRSIGRIKDLIALGETYQVNYTLRLRAPFTGSVWDLFRILAPAQEAAYAAFVDTGRFAVCSTSPELFFRLEDSRITSRPMKGTAARGRTLAEDEAQARRLGASTKDRAENLMIVDMVRNDLGRVAATGSVEVVSLFDLERYPTLWQMTSTVAARTEASFPEILTALFPCASITGAPKPNTTRIIAELESAPRQIYTGCIGHLSPGRRAQFNVAIRTVLVDRERGEAEYGVGGGIVWDSVDSSEYEEWRMKAKVVIERIPPFSLLETLLWDPKDGYFLLSYHLSRLAESARYFGYPADLSRVERALRELADSFPAEERRVRLLVGRDGAVSCEASPLDECARPATAVRALEASGAPIRLRLAASPVDSADPFLFHKTTHRRIYDGARAVCKDCDDVLLWNERGEITETCLANVVFDLDGQWVTPPVSCGLLAGTYRAWMLEQGRLRERVVTREMLGDGPGLYVINSVRGMRRAVLLD